MKKKLYTILSICLTISLTSVAQVKSAYLYNTSMPYGTLDIRTTISSTHYFYLQENITFSFRESSPGIKTKTFRDMTSWDSSPYKQGNLRLKNGTSDKFVMNYRLLMPNNYQSTYAEGYPMIVIMHGAVERGNCYYNSCYHSNFSYDPNINSPPAPKTVDHKLLNNDHHLAVGGKQHLDARTLAGTKLPNDPTLPARAFQGFVLMTQMMNDWDSLSVEHMVRVVQLHIKKYKIDPNRIYIHGLSIGGFAVYQAIKRAAWLFAAALPMSAVREAGYIFKHNQQNKVVHLPLWVFQGGMDTAPSPSFTEAVLTKFRNAGATPRYTLYPTLGHNVWGKAYSEPDFFAWMKSKNKSTVHPFKGVTVIDRSKSQYPKLMLAEGFFAYQWEKNGVILSATSNVYTATTPGSYRARFSRVSAPTATQWNKWSSPIAITEVTSTAAMARTQSDAESIEQVIEEEDSFTVDVYPNPASSNNLNLIIKVIVDVPVRIKLINGLGNSVYETMLDANQVNTETSLDSPDFLPDGMYILLVNQGQRQVNKKIIVKN